MAEKKLKFEDFPEKHMIRIEGINYDHALLKAFGKGGLAIGAILQIIKRDDKTVEFERRYMPVVQMNDINNLLRMWPAATPGISSRQYIANWLIGLGIEVTGQYKKGRKSNG